MLLCSRFLSLFLMATSKVAAACLCRVVRLCYCGAPSHSLCTNFLSLPVPYGPDIRPSLSPSSQSIGSPRRAAACECRSEPKTGRSLPTSALTEVPWRVAVTCHPSQCCCCTSIFKVGLAPSSSPSANFRANVQVQMGRCELVCARLCACLHVSASIALCPCERQLQIFSFHPFKPVSCQSRKTNWLWFVAIWRRYRIRLSSLPRLRVPAADRARAFIVESLVEISTALTLVSAGSIACVRCVKEVQAPVEAGIRVRRHRRADRSEKEQRKTVLGGSL